MNTATATKTKDTIKYTLTIDLDVDPDFVDYLTRFNDIFQQIRSGYWAFGVRPARTRNAWLVYAQEDDAMPNLKAIAEARRAHRCGEPLPARWYLLDRDAAARAWAEGVKLWGLKWYEDVDANREDCVVQMALLGSLKYA